jgi:hypothetical protein
MRTFAQKPKATQQTPAKSTMPGRADFWQSSEVSPILQLQRSIGNRVGLQAHAQEFEDQSPPRTLARFGHDFSRIPIRAHAPTTIQPKLQLNTPGDEREQEANRVAEQVTRVSEPQLQRTRAGGGFPESQNEQATHEQLQTKSIEANHTREMVRPRIVHEVLRSSGRPMDPATRAFFEPRFGHDFGKVRIHADTQASEAASAVNARAFTVGRDMVYGSGQYRPDSLSGRKLIAHELTHIIQQSGGGRAGRDVVQRKPSAEVTSDKATKTLNIKSNIVFYGSQVTDAIVSETASDIQNVWNAAKGIVTYQGDKYSVVFSITGECQTGLTAAEVAANTDVKQNYVRVELKGWKGYEISEYTLGGNSGLLLVENIKGAGSTSEGHEYGHGLGLDHPAAEASGAIKVTGQPTIMYPRGTLVDPEYQYDPTVAQGEKGGTIKPDTRIVTQQDIQNLVDNVVLGTDGKASIGTASNAFYED